MIKTKIIFYLILLILLSSFVSAEVFVEKDAVESIFLGDVLTVTIRIANTGNESLLFNVTEVIVNADPIDPVELIYLTVPKGMLAAFPPFYKWTVEVGANNFNDVVYKIKPTALGDYFIGQTEVVDENDNRYYSDSFVVEVKGKSNGVCDLSDGENYYNSKDCPSGSKDFVCDLMDDGICDPDCEKIADSDCKKDYSNILYYSFGVAILIIIILLVFRRINKPVAVKKDNYSDILNRLKK